MAPSPTYAETPVFRAVAMSMGTKPWARGPWTVGARRTTLARAPRAAKFRQARSPAMRKAAIPAVSGSSFSVVSRPAGMTRVPEVTTNGLPECSSGRPSVSIAVRSRLIMSPRSEKRLRAALTQSVADAPADLQPLETLLRAFRKAEGILEGNRPFAEPRLRVIAETPALRERDLAKAASISEALAEALRRRVPERLAGLASQTGWAAFHHAMQAWIDDPSRSLYAHLLQAFDDLRALSATAPPAQAPAQAQAQARPQA
ncbi:hypothetical protein GCM10027161_47830 [Microbispora hainanensis]